MSKCVVISLIVLWSCCVVASALLFVFSPYYLSGYSCPPNTFYLSNNRCMDDNSTIYHKVYYQELHNTGVALVSSASVLAFFWVTSLVVFLYRTHGQRP